MQPSSPARDGPRASTRPADRIPARKEARLAEVAGGRGQRLLAAGVFLVLFLALLWFPWPYHERLLDDGWSLALAWFMQKGARAGVDYVFTYGPLGYLAVPALVPELFAVKYVWSVAFAAVGALAVLRTAWLFRAPWLRVTFLWLALLSLPRTENRFFVVLLLVAALPVLEHDFRHARLAATTALLAVASLIKFTYFGFAGVLVVLLVVAAPQKARLTAAGSYLGAIAVTWFACGQSLLDLPRYVWTSLHVASGYSEAMSRAGDPRVTVAACVGTLSMITGIVLLRPRRTLLPAAGMVLLGALLSFKEAFVRQDADRSLVFFGYLALASAGCSLLAAEQARRAATGALMLPAALAVVLPVAVGSKPLLEVALPLQSVVDAWHSTGILLAPGRYLSASEPELRRGAREWGLPRVTERVRGEPIDVVTVDQSVLFYGGFDYRPRPVFQSYCAYTPELAELNAAFFRSNGAPRFVLARWTTIDGRFPAADDGPALLELLRLYRPVLTERDYLLLERTPRGSAQDEVVLAVTVQRGTRIALPTERGGLYAISIAVKPTFTGRVHGIAFRIPRLPFVVDTADGRSTRYELVSSVAAASFLISPVLESSDDLSRIYAGAGTRAVAVTVPPGEPGSFKHHGDEVVVRVTRRER